MVGGRVVVGAVVVGAAGLALLGARRPGAGTRMRIVPAAGTRIVGTRLHYVVSAA